MSFLVLSTHVLVFLGSHWTISTFSFIIGQFYTRTPLNPSGYSRNWRVAPLIGQYVIAIFLLVNYFSSLVEHIKFVAVVAFF